MKTPLFSRSRNQSGKVMFRLISEMSYFLSGSGGKAWCTSLSSDGKVEWPMWLML